MKKKIFLINATSICTPNRTKTNFRKLKRTRKNFDERKRTPIQRFDYTTNFHPLQMVQHEISTRKNDTEAKSILAETVN